VILSVGRLSAEKDYPTLLRAFALLQNQVPARLILLGEGGQRAGLERLASELGIGATVSLPGFVRNPFAYMARARVFVLSSLFEGFGNVLVEALACGCQVVSTHCPGGPGEILDRGRYGRLVPVGDHAALARAILEAIAEPMDTEALRRRADDFSVERAARRHLDALFPE
jgi:glycosyltransferase involved in cell wall biosynthesis